MSRFVSKLFILVLIAGTLPVFAGNKQNADNATVLINQATVQDAGGFPFKITAPGNFKLIGDLVVPANTSGILIQANDVTLDLNGFSITGPVACDFQGNNCTPAPTRETDGVEAVLSAQGNIFGVTIRNGHIRGFSFGVSTFSGLVEEITAYSNFSGGITAERAVVRRNDTSQNHGFGIGCNSCVVTENVANNNQGNGFVMSFGGVFGSNSTQNSFGADIDIGVTTQNNNNCSGHAC